MENNEYIQTTSLYGVKMNSYYDPKTDDFFIFSSNGVHCVLKNRQYIYFYKNSEFIVKTKSRYSYVEPNNESYQIINYLELSIFLHVNTTVVENLAKTLSQMYMPEDLTHMLHPKQMNYFFNFDHFQHTLGANFDFKSSQVLMIKYDGEFYYSNNSFFRINKSLSKFINDQTFCFTELYYSLETSKILFVHDLKWSVINLVYEPSTEILTISGKPLEKYKDSQNALDEIVPEVSIQLSESEMYAYVYDYLFKRSVEDLKPTMQQIFNDCDIILDSDYQYTLKIVDMLII